MSAGTCGLVRPKKHFQKKNYKYDILNHLYFGPSFVFQGTALRRFSQCFFLNCSSLVNHGDRHFHSFPPPPPHHHKKLPTALLSSYLYVKTFSVHKYIPFCIARDQDQYRHFSPICVKWLITGCWLVRLFFFDKIDLIGFLFSCDKILLYSVLVLFCAFIQVGISSL